MHWQSRWHSSQPAFARYKRAWNEYIRINKEEQRNYEKHIIDKEGKNPKLFHKFIRSHLSGNEHLIR